VHQRSAQSIRGEALFSEQPKPLFYSAESANSKKIINFAAQLLPPVSSGVLQNLIKFSAASTSAQIHREINVFPSLAQSYKFFSQNARDDHFSLFGKFPTLSAHSQPVLIKLTLLQICEQTWVIFAPFLVPRFSQIDAWVELAFVLSACTSKVCSLFFGMRAASKSSSRFGTQTGGKKCGSCYEYILWRRNFSAMYVYVLGEVAWQITSWIDLCTNEQ